MLKDAGLSALIRHLSPLEGVYSFSFRPLLCDGKRCRPEFDGVSLDRDEGHLTPSVSRTLGKQSGLNAYIDGFLTVNGK